MANRIFKYPLEVETRQLIVMPKGAKVLSIMEQNETPMLYALIDTDAEGTETRVFRVTTTGEIFNAEDARFVGSVGLKGWYVAHVFEQLPRNAPPDTAQKKFERERQDYQLEVRNGVSDIGLLAVVA